MNSGLILVVVFAIILFVLIIWNTSQHSDGYQIDRYYVDEKELNDFYSKVKSYYINLDRKPERRENAEKQFDKQRLDVTRFAAVNGKDIDLDDPQYQKYLEHTKDWYKEDERNKGHFGCFLSMIGVYDLALEQSDVIDYVMIFEDDIEFLTDDFKEMVYEKVKTAPDDWDIILFGYNMEDDDEYPNNELKLENGFINPTYFQGTHSHIIKVSSIEKIKEIVEPHEWLIDWNIGYGVRDGKLKVYGIYPPVNVCAPGMQAVRSNIVEEVNHTYNCKYDLGGYLDG